MIYTGYWAYPNMPREFVRIRISRGAPRWLKPQPSVPELFPGPWLYDVEDPEEYRSRYVGELAVLDPMQVYEKICCEAAGRTPVLCCFCKPSNSSYCHRSWVSVFLAHHLGLAVPELGMESEGSGASHPLLPAEYRRPLQVPAQLTPPIQLPLL